MDQAFLPIKLGPFDTTDVPGFYDKLYAEAKAAKEKHFSLQKDYSKRHVAIQSDEADSHVKLYEKAFEKIKVQNEKQEAYLFNLRKTSLQKASAEQEKAAQKEVSLAQKIEAQKEKAAQKTQALNEKITASHQKELDKQAKAEEAHALKVMKYHNMLVKNSLAQGDNQRGFREMISQAVGGKGGIEEAHRDFNKALAFVGGGFTTAEIMALGKEAVRVDNQMQGAFKTAGATAQQASLYARQTTADYEDLGIKLGLTETHYKELARIAAFTGQFLGDMNKQMIVAAGAIEKQTASAGDEGSVSADRFIRGISMGFLGEEGQNTLGRLRQSMPALYTELQKATDKEDLFNRAIKFTNESVQSQIDFINSDAGAVEKETVRRENQMARLGVSFNKLLGSVLHFAEIGNEGLDILFGTLDKEERAKFGAVLSTASDAVGVLTKTLVPAVWVMDLFGSKTKELTEEQKRQAQASNMATALQRQQNDAMQKARDDAGAAAQKIGVLADEYLRVKDALDKLDTGRQKIDFLESQAALAEQANGQTGTGWGGFTFKVDNTQWIADLDKQITEQGLVQDKFNKLKAKHKKFDPSDPGDEKTTTKADLENPLKRAQTEFELHGIQMKYTKEQIEIGLLNIQIKYDNLIAAHAKKNSNTQVEFALDAAHAAEHIREIENESIKKYLSEQDKYQEINLRFQLATTDEFGKKRLELIDRFEKDALTLSGEYYEKELAALWAMYQKENNIITQEETEKKIEKQSESQKKLLEAQNKYTEVRIKSLKNNVDQEIVLENVRWKKLLDIQALSYTVALSKAQTNGTDLQVIELENLTAIETLNIEHKERLKKIAEDSVKDIKEVFDAVANTTLTTVFKPIEDSLSKSKGLVGDIGRELLKIGEKKVLEFINKELFEPKPQGKPFGMLMSDKNPDKNISAQSIQTPRVDLKADVVNVNGVEGAENPSKPIVFPNGDVLGDLESGKTAGIGLGGGFGFAGLVEDPDKGTPRRSSGGNLIDLSKGKGSSQTTFDYDKVAHVAGEILDKGLELRDAVEKVGNGIMKAGEELLNSPELMILNKPFQRLFQQNGLTGEGDKVEADLAHGMTTMGRGTMNSIYAGAKPSNYGKPFGMLTSDANTPEDSTTTKAVKAGVVEGITTLGSKAAGGGKIGVGDILSSILGIGVGVATGGISKILGFAGGTDNIPSNTPYLVGEQGPELRYNNKIIPLDGITSKGRTGAIIAAEGRARGRTGTVIAAEGRTADRGRTGTVIAAEAIANRTGTVIAAAMSEMRSALDRSNQLLEHIASKAGYDPYSAPIANAQNLNERMWGAY